MRNLPSLAHLRQRPVLRKLESLRTLTLQYSGAMNASESLGKLDQLETLELDDCDVRDETGNQLRSKLAEVGITLVITPSAAKNVESNRSDATPNEATLLARRVHSDLATAHHFASFLVRWEVESGEIPAMSAEPIRTIRRLKTRLAPRRVRVGSV